MMLCGLCAEPAPITALCAGSNCAARVGLCCYAGDGLCAECARETSRPPTLREALTTLVGEAVRVAHYMDAEGLAVLAAAQALVDPVETR